MFSFAKNDLFDTKTSLVLSPNCDVILAITGDDAQKVLLFGSNAPKISTIRFRNNANIKENLTKDCSALVSIMDRLRVINFNLNVYLETVRSLKAELVNLGLPLCDIYGLKIGDRIYGYDYGFAFIYKEVEFYCDFSYVQNDQHNSVVLTAFDLLTKEYLPYIERKTGLFNDASTFSLNLLDFTSDLIIDLLGSVSSTDIQYLPNRSIIINNLYSNLSENSFAILKPNNNALELQLKGAIVNSIEKAIALRAEGAGILQQVATSPKVALGLTSVGTAKISSSAYIESIGDILLLESQPTGVAKSNAQYEETRAKFINMAVADNELQYNLAYHAGNSVYILGSAKTINANKLQELITPLISQQFDNSSNLVNHTLLDASGRVIGYLPSLTNSVTYSSDANIQREKVLTISLSDNVFSSHQLNNISVDVLNSKEARQQLEEKINYYLSKMSVLSFDDINSNIKIIDGYVAKSYQIFSSLSASSDVLSARAATILKAIENIFRFPMKTGYSAQDFGTLGEFFHIENKEDGSSVVSIIEGKYVPYFEQLTQNQCGTTWVTREPDPGRGYDNDILIGPVYSKTLNDLNGNTIGGETKSYYERRRQTRGSGDCEQEVISDSILEPRIVMKLNDFLIKIKSFLETLLNDEIMIANKQIKASIAKIEDSIKRYSDMRLPYQKQLLEYFDNQSQLFVTRHMLNLLNNVYNTDLDLKLSSNITYKALDEERFDNIQRAFINSCTRLINVDDVDLSVDDASFKEVKNNFSANALSIANKIDELKLLIVDQQAVEAHLREQSVEVTEQELDKYRKSLSININLKQLPTSEFTLSEDSFSPSVTELAILNNLFVISTEEYNRIVDELTALCIANTEAAKDLISIYKDIKAKLIERLKRVDITFNGEIVHSLNAVDNGESEFTIEVGTSKIKYKCIFAKEGKIFKLDIEPIAYEGDVCHSFDSIIQIGPLTYDIMNFLQHEYLYQVIPNSDEIDKKIKYCILNSTESSDEECYMKLAELYGNTIANMYTKYRSKTMNVYSMFALLMLAAAARPDLFLSTMLAFQDQTLGLLLKEQGLELKNVSGFADLIYKLGV